MTHHERPTPHWLRVGPARRCLDIVVGGTLLVLTAPLLCAAAVLVAIVDGRPVFFHQVRVGEGGQPFTLLKLRTMRAADDGADNGAGVTVAGDARVTRLGHALRRLSMDELPQLWDVVRGRMTLVGPRPESVDLARRYPPSCRFVLDARPGLTGPTQLRFREESARPGPGWPVEEWYLRVLVPLRVDCDLDYLRRPTLTRTLGYLIRTALYVTGLADYERSVVQPTKNRWKTA